MRNRETLRRERERSMRPSSPPSISKLVLAAILMASAILYGAEKHVMWLVAACIAGQFFVSVYLGSVIATRSTRESAKNVAQIISDPERPWR